MPDDDDPVISAAIERLLSAPTQALIKRPSTPVPIDPAIELAGWHRVDALTDRDFVTRLATAYSAGLDTPHRPVGGACGLQHYAGRFALAALGIWTQTGLLVDLAHRSWSVELDDLGHTIAVDPPRSSARRIASPDDVAAGVLAHLQPIVAAIRSATRITEQVAYGCIASSCAGAFGVLHRCAASEHREASIGLASAFMASAAWPADRPLIDLGLIALTDREALVHERRVCCLIRLGENHDVCATCPDLSPQERRRRIRARAASVPHSDHLRLGVARDRR